MDKRVVHLVACAAPPTRRITELVGLLHEDGWDVHVVSTPTASTWMPIGEVEKLTGHPVAHQARRPDQPNPMPPADAVIAAPLTFNTINRWATGVSDCIALGVLNEALGKRLPTIASVFANPALTAHPVFEVHRDFLAGAGVHFTETRAMKPLNPQEPFGWQAVTEILRKVM